MTWLHLSSLRTPRTVASLLAVVVLAGAGLAWAMFGQDQAPTDESWTELEWTDVVTGEAFKVMDLQGSAVVVEAMATWCGNCARQLGNLSQAAAVLAERGEQVEYVIVSVEVGLDPAALAAYATDRDLPFRFVVADDATLRALVSRFGRGVLNPPSTPHVVIDASGNVGELVTGFTQPDTLVQWLVDAGSQAD